MTELFNNFHFLRPLWLLALIPAALLCYRLSRNSSGSIRWREFISPHLLPYLLDEETGARRRWPYWGLFFLWCTASLAAAGPTWQRIPQPVEQNSNHLVIAWDMSPSMLAQDLAPSRLQRSRLKLIDLLQSRREGQAALVAYAGDAHTVTPLTDDVQTIVNLLPALSPTVMPSVGSNPESAIELSQQLLRDAGALTGDMLLVTDGIATDAFDHIVRLARESRYRLTIWGVGTTEGAPIPLPNGGFARDSAGNMVVPQLNQSELDQLAARVDGYYVPMVNNDSDVETLMLLLSGSGGASVDSSRTFDQWYEHGQLLALLLLPFLALLFRRGWVFCVAVALPFGLQTPNAQAFSWSELWRTQDQQAQAQLEAGEAQAAKQFTTPERRGAALYQQQEYEAAAEEFARADGPLQEYNRGTALTRAGRYEDALQAFDRVLEQAPDFKPAHDNRAIAQQLAELAQQQQEQEQQGGDQGESSDDQQEGESGQQGEGEQQAGDSSGNQQESGGGDEQSGNGEGSEGSSSEESVADGSDELNSEDNPYSQAEAASLANDQAQDEAGSDPSAALAAADSPGQSEEEQLLEQLLRKVPDDPGGLLRNKFRYEHLKRRQSMPDRSPYSNNDAEQRW